MVVKDKSSKKNFATGTFKLYKNADKKESTKPLK